MQTVQSTAQSPVAPVSASVGSCGVIQMNGQDYRLVPVANAPSFQAGAFVPVSGVLITASPAFPQLNWQDLEFAVRAGWSAHDQSPGMECEEVVNRVVRALKDLKGFPG